MSATGRTIAGADAPTPRQDFDDYPSPAFTVLRLLDALELPGGRWLEPFAGAGSIIRAVNSRRRDVVWTACEIQDKYRAPLIEATARPPSPDPALCADVKIGDFFKRDWSTYRYPFACTITNPPFLRAEEAIKRCLTISPIVVMLMRIPFLASEKRAAWLRKQTPDLYVLPNRPSFRPDGGTDATDYGWTVYGTARPIGSPGRIMILDVTPLAERRSR